MKIRQLEYFCAVAEEKSMPSFFDCKKRKSAE